MLKHDHLSLTIIKLLWVFNQYVH